jgi:hypothetical protein
MGSESTLEYTRNGVAGKSLDCGVVVPLALR